MSGSLACEVGAVKKQFNGKKVLLRRVICPQVVLLGSY